MALGFLPEDNPQAGNFVFRGPEIVGDPILRESECAHGLHNWENVDIADGLFKILMCQWCGAIDYCGAPKNFVDAMLDFPAQE